MTDLQYTVEELKERIECDLQRQTERYNETIEKIINKPNNLDASCSGTIVRAATELRVLNHIKLFLDGAEDEFDQEAAVEGLNRAFTNAMDETIRTSNSDFLNMENRAKANAWMKHWSDLDEFSGNYKAAIENMIC